MGVRRVADLVEGAKSDGGVGDAVKRLNEGGKFKRPVVSAIHLFSKRGEGELMLLGRLWIGIMGERVRLLFPLLQRYADIMAVIGDNESEILKLVGGFPKGNDS